MSEPLRIGLVGAGPWGHLFTGPMLAMAAREGSATFVGVWARRPDAAATLAATHASTAYDDLDALIDACDALTFSVPPDVQASLAARAASRGKSVLLDKPVGADVAQAEALAAAIDAAGVTSQVIFTNRYLDSMRAFLAEAHGRDLYGGRAAFFGNGAVPGTYFGTPWRVADGGLRDLGPHVLDALDAALGPITAIEAHGRMQGIVLLDCEHEGGRVSQVALSGRVDGGNGLSIEVLGLDGRLTFDAGAMSPEQTAAEFTVAQRRIVAELVDAVAAGRPHELDVHRGLHVQRLIDAAVAQLAVPSA